MSALDPGPLAEDLSARLTHQCQLQSDQHPRLRSRVHEEDPELWEADSAVPGLPRDGSTGGRGGPAPRTGTPMNSRPAARIYISRAEEDDIRRELDAIRADHTGRAVLLYRDRGVGKTSLVCHMADRHPDDGTIWLQPVDVDDLEIWLLSNLERRVADQLDDPDGHYFAAYPAGTLSAAECHQRGY